MQKNSSTFPVIAIAGSPRVGSMWTFNVTRALIREAGLAPVPKRVPKTDEEGLEIVASYLRSAAADSRCVVKLHSLLHVSPDLIVIRNKRDIRDRLFSYFQFLKVSIDEQSIEAAVSKSLAKEAHYDRWPADRILNIPFESIENQSDEVIRKIATFIGLSALNEKIIRSVDFRFSKQQVRKKIADLEHHVLDGEGNFKQGVNPDAVVEALGQVRAFDVDSGFQSGHVTDYCPGDWRHLWTERQKQMVDAAIRAASHRFAQKS